MLIKTRIVLSYFPSGLSFIKTEETRRSPSKEKKRGLMATIFPANYKKKSR